MYKLRRLYGRIYEGISSLIYWLPIIWQDRDWDKHFIYFLLYKKLEKMEKFFASDNAYALHSNDFANEIKFAKMIAKRLVDDEYLTNALIPYEKKYGEKELFTIVKDSYFSRVQDKQQGKNFSYWCKHADKMKQQDKEYLFKYLTKHIDKWWD